MDHKCPICKKNNFNLLVRINSKIVIEKCLECGLGITRPEPKNVNYSVEDFSDQFSFSKYEELPHIWKYSLDRQLSIICSYLSNNGKVLEIGCGDGLLLSTLRKKNSTYVLEGIEPSKAASNKAKSRGIFIYNKNFGKMILKGKKYDFIIMNHVLEHIKNLEKTILEINTLLNKNGYLLLSQTSYNGLIPQIEKQNWYAWVPHQHYYHFTDKSLNRLLTKNGFKEIMVKYSSLEHSNIIQYVSLLLPKMGDQIHILFKKE